MHSTVHDRRAMHEYFTDLNDSSSSSSNSGDSCGGAVLASDDDDCHHQSNKWATITTTSASQMQLLGLDAKLELNHADLRLIRPLGSGAFADVWLAELDSQLVAVKIIRNASDARIRRNFVREIRNLSTCATDNVVRLIGYTLTPRLTVVMEWASGGTLSSLVHDGDAMLGLADVIRYALMISRALEQVHRCGIVHRDVTLDNVLLSGMARAKLADFGVSRSFVDEPIEQRKCVVEGIGVDAMTAALGSEKCSSRRRRITPTGAPRYRAPEVTRGVLYGKSADVFSFGVCLHEMVTRRRPLAHLTAVNAARSIARGAKLPIPAHCPAALRQLLADTLSFVPASRPTFAQISSRLQAMLNLIQFAIAQAQSKKHGNNSNNAMLDD
jgi:serine/threonine protein kinase